MSGRRKNRIVVPTAEVVAYTAGIVDGEGSIQLNSTRSGDRYYWSLSVSVAMMAPDMLARLRAEWGGIGSLNAYKTRGKHAGRKYSAWRIYSAEAEKFLCAVLPYLRVKDEHARTAIEFRRFVVPKRGGITDEIARERRRLGEKLVALNSRTAKRPSAKHLSVVR